LTINRRVNLEGGAALVIVLVATLLLTLLIVSVLRMQSSADKQTALTLNEDRLDDQIGYCVSQAVQYGDRLKDLDCGLGAGARLSSNSVDFVQTFTQGYESVTKCSAQKLCSGSLACKAVSEYLLSVEVRDGENREEILLTLQPEGCEGDVASIVSEYGN